MRFRPYVILFLLLFAGICTVYSQSTLTVEDGWFVFSPTNTAEDGVIGMTQWLDAPAGKHGFVEINGSGFAFEDGTPIKFWGTNHSNKGCGPLKDEADKRAAWFAKMGINAVRLHKFTYARSAFGDTTYSSRLLDSGWERLDYYMAKLRDTGIYYGWSPIYGHRLVPGDSSRVLAYEEIRENAGRNIISLVDFAPDLQDVVIELVVNMLNHKNPHTGLRYADDPGLAFVELQNEDDVFFPQTRSQIEKCPTYKKLVCKQFSEWLRNKYGTHENLVKAWGEDGINMFPEQMTGEHLDKENIYPMANGYAMTPEELAKSPSKRRMLDTARFLYDAQMAYYMKFVAAIRGTGYKGPLVGSCWQAAHGVPHYYNLHTDYEVGIIDRHNYYGARPHSLTPGPFPNDKMVSHAGSGLLSSGLQAVKGRPFVLSEWISKMPNEWIVEGPAIIGVYGMGFQGWDGSYHFNSAASGFTGRLQGHNVYNTNLVTQVGLFPAVSRMIARGDISEGKLLPNRKVHIPSLIDGKLDFTEKVRQQADIKELGGDVPLDALALGRVEVEFTDTYEKNDLPDFSGLTTEKIARSNTGELLWDYSGDGYFTVNTAGTKAVVGHAAGITHKLGVVDISMKTEFAVLFVTALGRDRSISNANSILITALARARNTGMKFTYTAEESIMEEKGGPPLMIEPVRAEIKVNRIGTPTVHVLDHDGLRTGRTVPVENGRFEIDGAEHKAIWYEISYE